MAEAAGIPTKPIRGDDFYRRVYGRIYLLGYHWRPWYSHAKGLCAWLLEHARFDSALDVGCSTGWAVGHLAQRGKRAAGVDVAPQAVRVARMLRRDVREASATHLPFGDGEFDVVLSTDCLEHLRPEDAPLAMAEIARVARRYIAVRIGTNPDHNRWWRFIARTPLHLTVRPFDWWCERWIAMGVRTIYTNPQRCEAVFEKP